MSKDETSSCDTQRTTPRPKLFGVCPCDDTPSRDTRRTASPPKLFGTRPVDETSSYDTRKTTSFQCFYKNPTPLTQEATPKPDSLQLALEPPPVLTSQPGSRDATPFTDFKTYKDIKPTPPSPRIKTKNINPDTTVTVTKETSGKCEDVVSSTLGSEPWLLCNDRSKAIPKASTYPLPIKKDLPSQEFTHGLGGLCPGAGGGWSECHTVSSSGAVSPPPDIMGLYRLHEEIAAIKSISDNLRATGRIIYITNEGTNSGSGFWINGGFFITATHFQQWEAEKPTHDELRSFARETRTIRVSCETAFEAYDRHSDSVEVRLVDWILAFEIAVFRPTDASYRPPFSIPWCQVLEDFPKRIDLKHYFVCAAGYTGCGPSPLFQQHMATYKKDYPDLFEKGVLPAEPNYDLLFKPGRKTVSFGTVIKHDGDKFCVNASCWKGYSGGPVIAYQNGKEPFILGIIIGGCWDGFFNEAITFPRGFLLELGELYGYYD
ncbi:hypothetical protein ABW21_db0203250 [Orbilia brochopaga]|nr:hypothetical protein ABW21_db0203250 [Drechslerella brochopaga]